MKIAEENMDQGPNERIPSRAAVDDVVNPRARNPELEGGFERTRTMFGTGKLTLAVTKIPGYHLHWIADYPGRLEDAEENGYEYVLRSEVKRARRRGNDTDSAGEYMTCISGSHDSGKPLTMHLMKIKQEWYEENCAFYQSRARKVDEQIKSGKIDGVRRPETYIPNGSRISIDTKRE
jgi:hypothetical protein